MRGEHGVSLSQFAHDAGSSPHARGTRRGGKESATTPGIIPACAGNTEVAARDCRQPGDHPRMRGEHQHDRHGADVRTGSSPHARGTHGVLRLLCRDFGIIPACAGNTTGGDTDSLKIRDHPRMRGEHRLSVPSRARAPGSSPHARGTLDGGSPVWLAAGIIPACAGNTNSPTTPHATRGDHPRMRGEHP